MTGSTGSVRNEMSQSLTFLDNFSFCDEIRPDVARYVRLDPNFQLAKNNLAWSLSEKQKHAASR